MDRIQKGDLHVEYCPTMEMLTDFFYKPLQGSTFHKLWAQVMNLPEDIPLPLTTTGPQECIGAHGNTWADIVRGTNDLVQSSTSNDNTKNDVKEQHGITKTSKQVRQQ
jgi:hypothetical protein